TKAERRTLEASERSYRVLFDANPQPMWTFDQKTLRFLTVNNAAIQKYGYTATEFRDMTILDIRPAEDRGLVDEQVRQRHAAGQHTDTGTARHLLKDGRLIDVEVTVEDVEIGGTAATLALARDITDQRRLESELHERAFRDGLTGLANRALLTDRFEYAQAVRTREGRELALLVFNLDGFKAINDTFGHAIGDRVLQEVATRLRSEIRPQDTVS